MKKALSVMVIALLALPAFAQDDFGGGGFGGFDGVLTGSDIDALLGGGNRGNRGNNNNNQDQIPNPETLLLQVKDLLKVKKVPLSKDQEKVLKTFLETETVTMRTELEAQFSNRGNHELPHGMHLPRGQHVVVGLGLLHHQPHALDEIARMAPVALGVEVP